MRHSAPDREITQAVLSARLSHLVENGLLKRRAVADDGAREEYHLTGKGRALFPAVVALMQRGDHLIHGDVGAPLELHDRQTTNAVDPLQVTAADAEVDVRQLLLTPGPGATSETRRRLQRSGG